MLDGREGEWFSSSPLAPLLRLQDAGTGERSGTSWESAHQCHRSVSLPNDTRRNTGQGTNCSGAHWTMDPWPL